MRLAILEDSRSQALLLKTMVEELGHEGVVFASAQEFRRGLEAQPFDLLLMDWILPDGSGDELLRWVRQRFGWSLPVIFVTARVAESDVVAMLRLGADDYVCKPIRYVELSARIEALIRRQALAGGVRESAALTVGNIVLDPAARSAQVDGRPVALTGKEFDLALLLLANLGTLFNRQTLLEKVWEVDAEIDTRTVDTHVSRLRRKLGLEPANGWLLTTVYGHGYRLERAHG
ncbi:response regulator transcription factor [Azospira restricta]|uniref:Response regulator transcription factor n=1 Tax=Azospira restricta TaxID=404405 RepID=A0A974PX92_9RHOO|nr:response regulator transcription factor [Azospira restricta]QRJ62838.1 response regulator transcription factor [Azospira restricta]